MGIVNLTDDSFFAASRTGGNADTALKMAAELASGGADIIDLGAESTRPGSARVTEDEEKKRISEAVRLVRRELPQTPISIDTTRASVARAALEEGADIINDISGLTYDSDIAKVSAEYGAMLVLMHMRGTPETMNAMCQYSDILFEINQFFEKQIVLPQSRSGWTVHA
jgi:dihydropteroate synthase